MFKIKGFSLFLVLILSLVYQRSWALPDTTGSKNTTCYGQGVEITDSTIHCCSGLEPLTEMNTHKKFCDLKPSTSSHYYLWALMLIFPFFLLVFVIFGIRNKMAHRKNKTRQ